MKSFVAWTLSMMVLALAATGSVWAIPPFKKHFDDQYSANEGVKKASDELKCNICHYGKSKKNLNDYGKELHKLLKKDNFKEERIKSEGDKVKAELEAAFKKVEGEKSKSGESFGERLKAGKAPGTPEEAK